MDEAAGRMREPTRDNPNHSGDARSISMSLDRGLVLLDLIAESTDGLTVGDAAAASGIHRTIASRLLRTLAGRRYVVRDEDGRYFLGSRPLELSRFVRPRIRSAALPVLHDLAQKVGATAHLTMADGDEAVAILVVEPTSAQFHISYRVGNRRPLWLGASGIAILSARAPGQAEAPEVATARERGWAMSHGQLEAGMTGIAAPVPSVHHTGYSIGVVMLGRPDDLAPIAAEVVSAARLVAGRLGE